MRDRLLAPLLKLATIYTKISHDLQRNMLRNGVSLLHLSVVLKQYEL
jgi:hypothetical protein